jgi:hypothetical protein
MVLGKLVIHTKKTETSSLFLKIENSKSSKDINVRLKNFKLTRGNHIEKTSKFSIGNNFLIGLHQLWK